MKRTYLTLSKKLTYLLSVGYIRTFSSLDSFVDSKEFNHFWGSEGINKDLEDILNEDFAPKFREGKTLFVFLAEDISVSQFREDNDIKEFVDIAYNSHIDLI